MKNANQLSASPLDYNEEIREYPEESQYALNTPEETSNYSDKKNEAPIDPWEDLEEVPFAPESPQSPQPPQEILDKKSEIERAIPPMTEQLKRLESKKSELEENLGEIKSTITQFKDTIRTLENEAKAPGEAAGSRRRNKSNVVSRFLQRTDLSNYVRADLVDNLESILDTHDVDIVIRELGKSRVGENYNTLLPYSSAEELFPYLTDDGIKQNLDSLLYEGISPDKIFPRLTSADKANNLDIFEKYNIPIDVNKLLPRLSYESISRNINYLASHGATFDSLVGTMRPQDIINNLDALMALKNSDINSVIKRLDSFPHTPRYSDEYRSILERFQNQSE